VGSRLNHGMADRARLERAQATCLASRELDQNFGEELRGDETGVGAPNRRPGPRRRWLCRPPYWGGVAARQPATAREVRCTATGHTVLRLKCSEALVDESTFSSPVQIAVSQRRGE